MAGSPFRSSACCVSSFVLEVLASSCPTIRASSWLATPTRCAPWTRVSLEGAARGSRRASGLLPGLSRPGGGSPLTERSAGRCSRKGRRLPGRRDTPRLGRRPLEDPRPRSPLAPVAPHSPQRGSARGGGCAPRLQRIRRRAVRVLACSARTTGPAPRCACGARAARAARARLEGASLDASRHRSGRSPSGGSPEPWRSRSRAPEP